MPTPTNWTPRKVMEYLRDHKLDMQFPGGQTISSLVLPALDELDALRGAGEVTAPGEEAYGVLEGALSHHANKLAFMRSMLEKAAKSAMELDVRKLIARALAGTRADDPAVITSCPECGRGASTDTERALASTRELLGVMTNRMREAQDELHHAQDLQQARDHARRAVREGKGTEACPYEACETIKAMAEGSNTIPLGTSDGRVMELGATWREALIDEERVMLHEALEAEARVVSTRWPDDPTLGVIRVLLAKLDEHAARYGGSADTEP